MTVAATRLTLRVAPGARRSQVVGRHGDGWKVRVAATPEAGRANEALRGLLAEALALPRQAVTVVSGHGSRDKLVGSRASARRRPSGASPARRRPERTPE